MTCYYTVLERICVHRKGKPRFLKTEVSTMKMNSKTAAKAGTYRLQRAITPEHFEMNLMHNSGTILTFGDHILVAAIWEEVKDRLKKSALGLSGGQ